MIIYLIIVRPFDNFMTNIMHIYNEFLILFAFLSVLVSNSISIRADIEEVLGLITIIAIFISLLITWGLFLPKIVSNVLAIVSGTPKKGKAKSENDDKSKMNNEVGSKMDQIEVKAPTLRKTEVENERKAPNLKRKKGKEKLENTHISY